ncbi:MAG: MTH938/NDUFAF3 family protein [Chloroflexi bacterium]|nr:MTH938/NDUFAF3 family protein [Chloroflexota bacterium]
MTSVMYAAREEASVMTAPKIDHYRFGEVIIDGRPYSHDVIVYPEGVDDQWWREEGHSLAPGDIWQVLQAAPEVLIVGRGSAGRMRVREETEEMLRKSGIEVIAELTELACDAYNRLRESKRVVAALHLTC